MDPAFELGRQHQEHDDEGQRKSNVDGRRGFLEFPAQSLVTDPGFRRQVIHSQVVQVGQGRAQVIAIGERGTDDHGRQAVDTTQVRVGANLLHRDQCLQGDQISALTGPQENLAQIFRRCPVGFLGLDDHIVLPAPIDVGGYLP